MLATREAAEAVDEVSWVVDYLDDLEADFQAWYGIDDMWSLSGPRWLRLATRTVAYAGVMRARADSLIGAERSTSAPDAAPEAAAPSGDKVRVIEPTREAIAASPLASLIEMG